ncbi:anti-sigma factor [Mesorhizobium sp. RP14(2022)]|uniref:Anti-sigma factor n=1 Tax=Mesorhizobium liriopis TaxID=2953882 RepID=A0ABT1C2B4_9HYPH|nr:anti-sigma factor [Mesorhizobium liriopis]MCO6048955.1 anti-sigma factor [Mesorhizobium liriopis]
MTDSADPVVQADLDAYVDDQLDAARRIAVEAHLAARPEEAARVMSDLRNRDELRLALAVPQPGARPSTTEAARRLERGLRRGRVLSLFQRAAAVAVLVGAGWMLNDAAGPLVGPVVASVPPPAYVEDAVQAHGTSVLRASMHSQPVSQGYDPAEIRSATAITMPTLPADWRVRDVQVYPSRFGPSVELQAQSKSFGQLSLFAVRPGTFDVVKPTLVPGEGASAAYFQVGEVAYALVSHGDAQALDRAAAELARSLY